MRDLREKIFTHAAAVRWRSSQGGVVVFTNGVFDLIHSGHVDLLLAARAEGDALIVALNSDASVRRLAKGPERPIRTEAERAYVLSALLMVDAVVVFDEDTPLSIVEALQPDVIVKGGDYSPETVVGANVVRARRGRVVIVPLTAGHSTTAIVNKLQQSSGPST